MTSVLESHPPNPNEVRAEVTYISDDDAANLTADTDDDVIIKNYQKRESVVISDTDGTESRKSDSEADFMAVADEEQGSKDAEPLPLQQGIPAAQDSVALNNEQAKTAQGMADASLMAQYENQDANEDQEFEVEKILDRKIFKVPLYCFIVTVINNFRDVFIIFCNGKALMIHTTHGNQ